MTSRYYLPLTAALIAGLAAGCSNSGSNLSTAGIAPEKTVAEASKVDPACVTLANQITTLRNEGAVANLEKAATGKGKSVEVKRASLSKQAELNKANADFQSKCGPKIPAQAAAAPAPAATAAAAAQTGAPAAAAKVAPVAAAAAAPAEVAKDAAKDAAKTAVKAAVQ